jgi:hypothetical protein
MPVEMVQMVAGLLLGLAIALFHRRIADYMLQQERALDYLFRSRGVRLPPPPSESTARNIYFILGIVIALLQAGRLLLLLRGI